MSVSVTKTCIPAGISDTATSGVGSPWNNYVQRRKAKRNFTALLSTYLTYKYNGGTPIFTLFAPLFPVNSASQIITFTLLSPLILWDWTPGGGIYFHNPVNIVNSQQLHRYPLINPVATINSGLHSNYDYTSDVYQYTWNVPANSQANSVINASGLQYTGTNTLVTIAHGLITIVQAQG